MSRLLFAACLLTIACASRAATDWLVPMDVASLLKSGEVTVTATKFDLGDIAGIFDTDATTMARTPSINPAFVEIAFTQPQTVSGFGLKFTDEPHSFKVLAGDATGKLTEVAKGTAEGAHETSARLSKPLTAKIFRFEVKRLEGDDFVHFFSLHFLVPGQLTTLKLNAPAAETPMNSVLRFTASAATSTGLTLDVTSDAKFTVSPSANELFRTNNAVWFRESGKATITAKVGDLTQSADVTVLPGSVTNDKFDLDVLFIERTPRINYDANRKTGGWPAKGQRVEWVAHLKSWGKRDIAEAGYRWVLDGKVAGKGAIMDWKAGTEKTVSLPWRWEKKRHNLAFILDPEGRFEDEVSRRNNQVTIDTDALAVGYWVEEGLADWMHEHQMKLGDGMNSFEDWGQRQMLIWNQMNANARFGTSPNGITDRVRLDLVVHVPTGALPLNGGIPTNNPDVKDKTVDLMWGMVGTPDALKPDGFWKVDKGGPMFYEYGLIHELNHARYVIDSYGFDVHPNALDDLKLPDGTPMVGSDAMPWDKWIVHHNKYKGLMGGGLQGFSEYEAYQWNRIAGKRASQGNQNSPGNIGEFLNTDLPQRNHVRILNQNGLPLSGAKVALHTVQGRGDGWYWKKYSNTPTATYTANEGGWIELPRCPFGEKVRHDYGCANSVMLLVITANGVTRTCFVEVTDFNLQYYRGYRDEAFYEVTVNTAPGNTQAGSIRGGTWNH